MSGNTEARLQSAQSSLRCVEVAQRTNTGASLLISSPRAEWNFESLFAVAVDVLLQPLTVMKQIVVGSVGSRPDVC